MRLADRPSVEVDVVVAAPPDVVWTLVTDVARMGDWSPEYQGGEWIDDATGPIRGARFRGRNRRGEREWVTVSVVTEATPLRTFAFAVGDPANPAASWRFDLEPADNGTRVVQRVELGPGPSGLTMAIARMPDREEDIVANRCEEHRRNMRATLDGLRRAAEEAR